MMKEYLESGALEAYAAGLLNAEERAEVERMFSLHPELRAELDTIEAFLEVYAAANAVHPKPELKNKVMDAVFSRKDTPVVSLWSIPSFRYAAAATIAVLVVMGLSLVVLFRNYSQQKQVLALLSDQNVVLRHEIAQSSQQVAMLESIRKPAMGKVVLAGLAKYPTADAVVYWDAESKMVTIDCIHLPDADTKHQYQLWALVNGKPVDAGVFQEKDSFRQLKKVEAAQAFAVTLEPMGGSASPTMEKMYLYTQL